MPHVIETRGGKLPCPEYLDIRDKNGCESCPQFQQYGRSTPAKENDYVSRVTVHCNSNRPEDDVVKETFETMGIAFYGMKPEKPIGNEADSDAAVEALKTADLEAEEKARDKARHPWYRDGTPD
jgi:hypothetical protein